MRLRVVAWLLALCLAFAAGCGYHVVNSGGAIPTGVHTVAVLPFANHTRTPGLSQQLSAAVAKEFLQRTHYRIQTKEEGSDVAVHGDLLSYLATPVTFDDASGRATTVEVVIHLKVWLTSTGNGKELFRNDDMIFHDQYQISSQEQNFIEEASAANDRLATTVAQTLVSDILEAF